MQDMRALKNPRTLESWRRWDAEANQSSGVIAILAAVAVLTPAFVVACALYGRAPGHAEAPVVLVGWGLYAALVLGLMAFALLRLEAWKRANPWTPPSASGPLGRTPSVWPVVPDLPGATPPPPRPGAPRGSP